MSPEMLSSFGGGVRYAPSGQYWKRWGGAPLPVRMCVLGICPEGGPWTGRVQYQRTSPPNI